MDFAAQRLVHGHWYLYANSTIVATAETQEKLYSLPDIEGFLDRCPMVFHAIHPKEEVKKVTGFCFALQCAFRPNDAGEEHLPQFHQAEFTPLIPANE